MQHLTINRTINSFAHKKTNNKYISIISTALLCATSNFVVAAEQTAKTDECSSASFYEEHKLLAWQPEVGIDFGFTRTKFKDGQGDKLLNRNQTPFNVFFGFGLTERIGIELGYGESRNKNKTVHFVPGEAAPGNDMIRTGQFQDYSASLSFNQPYVSLTYKHPIGEKLQLFGAAGVTYMKMLSSWENINIATGKPTPTTASFRRHSMNERKNVPLIKLGLYYPLVKSFSLRLTTTWLQTSKFKSLIIGAGPGFNSSYIKAKSTVNYSLGIVYTI